MAVFSKDLNDNLFSAPVNQILGVILGGGKGTRLFPLTKDRSKPAVPFAGNYRLIDISISNCIHSGINQMWVLTQYNSASLNHHIVQTYNFDVFHKGFVDIMTSEQSFDKQADGFSQGTADAVRKVLKYLRRFRKARYALILAGDQLYHMDFGRLLKLHLEKKADITVGIVPVCEESVRRFGILRQNPDGRVINFSEKPESSETVQSWCVRREGKNRYQASMGIYLFDLDLLEGILEENPQMMDFGKEILPMAIENYRVFGYEHEDFWEDIGTISAYHEASTELGKLNPKFKLISKTFTLFTHPRFLPPARIFDALIKESLISDGVKLQECRIESSVIGIRSQIRKGVVLKKVVVMGADYYEFASDYETNLKKGIPDVAIGENSRIENAIIDKNCRIGKNVTITNAKGIRHADFENYCVRDGIVVLPKNTIILDGTVI